MAVTCPLSCTCHPLQINTDCKKASPWGPSPHLHHSSGKLEYRVRITEACNTYFYEMQSSWLSNTLAYPLQISADCKMFHKVSVHSDIIFRFRKSIGYRSIRIANLTLLRCNSHFNIANLSWFIGCRSRRNARWFLGPQSSFVLLSFFS